MNREGTAVSFSTSSPTAGRREAVAKETKASVIPLKHQAAEIWRYKIPRTGAKLPFFLLSLFESLRPDARGANAEALEAESSPSPLSELIKPRPPQRKRGGNMLTCIFIQF